MLFHLLWTCVTLTHTHLQKDTQIKTLYQTQTTVCIPELFMPVHVNLCARMFSRSLSLTHTCTHKQIWWTQAMSIPHFPRLQDPFGAHMLTICANLSHWNSFTGGNDSLEGCNFRNRVLPCGVSHWLARTRLIWASFCRTGKHRLLLRDCHMLAKRSQATVCHWRIQKVKWWCN